MSHVMYVNHLGSSVDLDTDGVSAERGRESEWAYSALELNGRMSSFRREAKSFELAVAVWGATADEACARNDALIDCFAADVDAERPGALVVDGWSMPAYVLSSSREVHVGGRSARHVFTVVSDDPRWTRERTTSFFPVLGGGSGDLDYPRGYRYDYRAESPRKAVSNPASTASAMRIAFYGPADHPRVTVGGNVYEVDAPLSDGDLLVVDGLARTITRIRANGFRENVFWARVGEQRPGSGGFVFEPVAPGLSEVSWDGSFGFDLTLFERRDERRGSL